jgi:hypothetical protein
MQAGETIMTCLVYDVADLQQLCLRVSAVVVKNNMAQHQCATQAAEAAAGGRPALLSLTWHVLLGHNTC